MMKGGGRRAVVAAAATVVVWACLWGRAEGYSQGAPSSSCSDMVPQHGVPKQTSPAPYTITPGTVGVQGGQTMLVTLEAPNGGTFKGFLVQARSSDTQTILGKFITTDHKYLNCDGGMNNSVTHRGPAEKTKVSLMWVPPYDFNGDVVFMATFVQVKSIFWVGLTSEKVTVELVASPDSSQSPDESPPEEPEEEEEEEEAAGLERAVVNIYDDCNTNKGCYGSPNECESNNNCEMMVTYSKVPSGYKFEIVGTASSGYVAAGLSDDDKMGDDSVMACIIRPSGADVAMGFNNGKNNELLANEKYGLSEIQAAQIDGKLYCTFVRQAVTEISGIVFDLESDRYHLMLAKGPTTPNGLVYHDKRTVSSGTVALATFEAVTSKSDLFITLHACFMIGAWIMAASCGIIVARYYKKTWLRSRSCGIDQWFHLHRFFMGLTWALTMVGVFFIAYYLDGWTELDPKVNPHAILGVVCTVLCFVQPFMALCRCGPTDKRRPIFNWLHWLVGNCAQIFGITAIFFGFELMSTPQWISFILIIFIAFHCIIHLILSVGQCVSDSKAESSSDVYPMKEVNGSRTPLQPDDKRLDAPGAGFRKTMLAFYFLVNWIITAALIVIVVAGVDQLTKWGLIFWEDK